MSWGKWLFGVFIGTALLLCIWFGWSIRQTVSLAEAQATAESAFRALQRNDQPAFEALLHPSVGNQKSRFWQQWGQIRAQFGALEKWRMLDGESLIGRQEAQLLFELECERATCISMLVLKGDPPRIAEFETRLKMLGSLEHAQ